MIKEKTITNKYDANISVQAINDVLNTKRILRELNILNSIDDDGTTSRELYLVEQLSMMWDGDKYSHSSRG